MTTRGMYHRCEKCRKLKLAHDEIQTQKKSNISDKKIHTNLVSKPISKNSGFVDGKTFKPTKIAPSIGILSNKGQ